MIQGHLAGKKLMPITMTIQTEPEITAQGFSRSIVVKNNAARPVSAKASFQMLGHMVSPGTVSFDDLQGGQAKVEAISISQTRKSKYTTNRRLPYRIAYSWREKKNEGIGRYFAFSPMKKSKVDYNNLPFKAVSEQGGFEVSFLLLMKSDYLRIITKV